MKFVSRPLGEAAEASSGGGPRGQRREFLVLTSLTAGLALVLYLAMGWIVEALLPRISTATEARWFGTFKPQEAVSEHELPRDLQARFALARSILARLSQEPGVPGLDYRLTLLDTPQVNAVAFPGGAIGVTRGLLELLDEEIGLAFVLGHELGHFAQRDHLRRVGRTAGRTLVWVLLFGGDAAAALGSLGPELLELRHQRRQEASADRFALRLVVGAYGTAEGSERLFAWMARRQDQPQWLALLTTHPAPKDRLAALRAALDLQPSPIHRVAPNPAPGSGKSSP